MNTNLESAQKLIASLSGKIKHEDCTVVVAPPFPFLRMFKEAGNDSILLGAQNCNHNESGAFTGEVSLDMLRSLSVKYVILGHSERREYFQESNELIATKVDKALEHGLTPIFCCGEPLEIRESGSYVDFVCDQIEQSLFFLSNDEISKVVVAYEPIWAIGTGKTASSEQAQEMLSLHT